MPHVKRVLLVEDNPHMRAAVRTVIDADEGLRVVAEAACGADALVLANSEQPDVVVFDLHLPATRAFSTLCELRRLAPDAAILVYTASARESDARDALMAGARGFLSKDVSGAELVRAIHGVAGGRTWLTRAVREAFDMAVYA
jgi:DNA-binding NarL/FixJ family response regulator